MPVNVIVTGAAGRMGREIINFVLNDPQTCLVGCLEYPGHPLTGSSVTSLVGRPCDVKISDSIDSLDLDTSIIIDFTSPQASLDLLKSLGKSRAGVVIGTTGIVGADLEPIRDASQHRPIVHSPNMSLGVNLLFHLTHLVASRLGAGFDIEIVEAHHRFKKDAPSGTARRLGEIAAAALQQTYDEAVVNGREGMVGERSAGEIGMHAVRGGDIVGDHTVLFAGLGERIELRHMAHSRSTFAQGAVHAAKWLAGHDKGLYSMQDVLGF